MAIVYHITSIEQWKNALREGFYTDPSLESEGFIHCSQDHQVEGVIKRYFSGRQNLLKLVIDTTKLSSPLQFDLAPSINQEFPHVYGPINLEAVVEVMKI